ncbi:MAG: hypothetical protein ACI4O9_08165 [Akkermansia sp.]
MAFYREKRDCAALLGQLEPWERGCCERAHEAWISLLAAVQERDTGRKLVALDALLGQLRAWRDLLQKGGPDA